MFIKRLTISSRSEIIRDMKFSSGLNLIIDNTPLEDSKSTGNNVGKTTVLKLIDFCLGAKGDIIYSGTENKKEIYDTVKEFLIDEEVEVTLTLSDDLEVLNAKEVVIQRNFLQYKNAVRRINGKTVADKDFETELEKWIIPNKNIEKPTLRQIISHNIRYKDESINNTLKTLNKYTTDIEYETLYLYLLGCSFDKGAEKQALIAKINQEELFKERLQKKQTRNTYEMALALIDEEIDRLYDKKASFNLNDRLEEDLEQLNLVKYNINKTSSLISRLEVRRNLIEESQREMESNISHIDLQQLNVLYSEVTSNVAGIQKTFEDLVNYHNNMVIEKVKYISRELPELTTKIELMHEELLSLLVQEKELTDKVAKGDSFEELEKVILELNEKYRQKGEYESVISQLNEVEESISQLNNQISVINDYLYSGNFEELVKTQVMKFNRYFSGVSQELYGEKYALTYNVKEDKKGRRYYKFDSFNANMSSGKKQGEILCFDLAYLLFAEEEKYPCLQFLLNDKKELMHDNQLIKVAEFVQNKNIQLVISILKDKLPSTVLNSAHVVIELAQNEKLFMIENHK